MSCLCNVFENTYVSQTFSINILSSTMTLIQIFKENSLKKKKNTITIYFHRLTHSSKNPRFLHKSNFPKKLRIHPNEPVPKRWTMTRIDQLVGEETSSKETPEDDERSKDTMEDGGRVRWGLSVCAFVVRLTCLRPWQGLSRRWIENRVDAISMTIIYI